MAPETPQNTRNLPKAPPQLPEAHGGQGQRRQSLNGKCLTGERKDVFNNRPEIKAEEGTGMRFQVCMGLGIHAVPLLEALIGRLFLEDVFSRLSQN